MSGVSKAEPIKVLHVVGGTENKGGIMTFVQQVCALDLSGVRNLVWKHQEFDPGEDRTGFVCRSRVRRTDVNSLGDLIAAILDAARLLLWVRRNRPVLLYAHSRSGILSASIASRLASVPLLIHLHALGNQPWIYRFLWAFAKATPVFNSRKTCLHYGCDPRASAVIMPFITWPTKPMTKRAPGIRFIAASRVVRLKNFHLIIEAFESLRQDGIDAQLLIFGFSDPAPDPAYEKELRKMAAGNPSICVLEYDPQWSVRLMDGDIFVHAATNESFGIVMLEAYARGSRLVVPSGTFLDDLAEPCRSLAIFRVENVSVAGLYQQMKEAARQVLCSPRLWSHRLAARNLFSAESARTKLSELYQLN